MLTQSHFVSSWFFIAMNNSVDSDLFRLLNHVHTESDNNLSCNKTTFKVKEKTQIKTSLCFITSAVSVGNCRAFPVENRSTFSHYKS